MVLAVSIFTHFYRLDHTFIFHNDEGRDVLIAYRMLDTKLPVLLGPETSVGNMYLGPFYYYLMVPSLWLSQLSPVGPAAMVALFGVLTTGLLIYLGRRYHSLSTGLAAGLFYALSPVMVHYSRSSWNPNVIPFFISLLLVISLRRTHWRVFLFGLVTGIIFQLHYVALVLPALLYLRTVLHYIRRQELRTLLIHSLIIVGGFILATLPFWLFEFRHSFVNTQAFLTYFQEPERQALNAGSYLRQLYLNLLLVVRGIMGSQSIMLTPSPSSFTVLGTVVLLVFVLTNRMLLAYLLVASLLLVSLLRENMHVHYLGFLFPVISLIIGLSLTKSRILGGITLLLLIVLTLPTLAALRYNLTGINSIQVERARAVANYIVTQAAGRPYNVVNSQGTVSIPITYYLAISAAPPQNDLQPLIFDVCEDRPCPLDDETTTLLFLAGPSHPSLTEYLGHPQLNEFKGKRKIILNEPVSYNIHVATIHLEP